MKNSEICEGIVEVIEERGWGKYFSENPKTKKVCLVGAGRVVLGFDARATLMPDEVRVELHNSIATALGYRRSAQVQLLNDEDISSQEEAIDFCTSKAKYWRNLGE